MTGIFSSIGAKMSSIIIIFRDNIAQAFRANLVDYWSDSSTHERQSRIQAETHTLNYGSRIIEWNKTQIFNFIIIPNVWFYLYPVNLANYFNNNNNKHICITFSPFFSSWMCMCIHNLNGLISIYSFIVFYNHRNIIGPNMLWKYRLYFLTYLKLLTSSLFDHLALVQKS